MNRPTALRPRPSFTSSRPLPGRGNTLRRLSLGLVSTSLLGSWASPSLWALQSAVVRGESVNVRGQASLAGEVLVQLNQGDIIQMVDKIVAVGAKDGSPSRWAQIQIPPSVPVYVHGTFLDGDTVAATKLNIRGGPGENYSVLGSLQRGAKIHSLGKQGSWVRIRPTPETYAFVAADYVVKSAPPAPASRPAVAAPIPMTVTAPAPRVIPPAPPGVPAETPRVTTEQTSARAATAPIDVAPATPAVNSTTTAIALPPIPPAAAPIAVPDVLTVARDQPVTPDEPLEEGPANDATSPDEPAVSTAAQTVPSEQTSSPVAPPTIVLAQAVPAESFSSPISVAPPAPPAAAPIAVPDVLTLAQAQPVAPTNPLDNLAAKPAASSTASLPVGERVGRLEPTHDAPHRNHISFGYRFGLNSSVEFKGFAIPPQPSAGIFDDGYVQDSSRQTAGPNPAADGRTWNWGYDSPIQVQGDTLLLTHSYLQAGTDSHKLDDGPASGFELAYALELYRGGNFDACHFGLEAAFNYTALDVKNSWTHSLDIVRDTTTYELGGVVPPYDPLTGQTYHGNYGGPGPTIPLNGTLSQVTVPSGPSMTSYRELAANTYGLRLGPYLESPLYKSLWGTVGTGLAIGLVDGELKYADSIHGLPLSGSASDFSTLVGWYIGGGLSYKYNDSWSLFYNLQYQWLPDYTLKAGDTEARFKAGNGLFQSLGIRYSF